MANLQDFKKLELRVAQIKEVNDHPDANKLYVLKIDSGNREKQIVAGIKGSYPKEELIGKQIVVIDNLEPAVLRGIESQGMLLAAQDEKGITLLIPERTVKIGSMVR